MLEAYSLNVEVGEDTAIPFNSVSVNKGCDEVLSSAATIELNKKGAYMVTFDASLATAGTVQLFKDGIPQPQAQATGTNPSFSSIVQVGKNNCDCCCSIPVTIQIKNEGTAAATFTNCNITVNKIKTCGR